MNLSFKFKILDNDPLIGPLISVVKKTQNASARHVEPAIEGGLNA